MPQHLLRRSWQLAWIGLTLVALAVALAFATWPPASAPFDARIDFESDRYGSPPDPFDFTATGSGGPLLTAGRPFWRTYTDLNAPSLPNVLIMAAGRAETGHYPLALLRQGVQQNDAPRLHDGKLSVWIKPVGGSLAQAAGLAWRVQDKDNYYALLADALDGQLRLLVVTGGQAREINSASVPVKNQYEQTSPLPKWGWYQLEVEVQGEAVTAWFDGAQVLKASDRAITRSGRVGLITHADSVALFDDFSAKSGTEIDKPNRK
jgi:hypothetical protein